MGSSKKGSSKKKAKKAKLPKSLRKGLPKPVADVLAAGLGALDRAQAKGTDEFQRLVEKGRAVEQRGSDAVRDATARVGAVVEDTVGAARARRDAAAEAVQSRVDAAAEAAVRALGLPTGADVAALRAELERLEARAEGDGAGSARAAVFRVSPHADGWSLERDGARRALSVHATKKAALVAARAHARGHAPSTLEILRADGSLADTTVYDG